MRKLTLFSLTALTAAFVAGVPAMTSQAAMYQIPIGISGQDCQNLFNGGSFNGGSFNIGNLGNGIIFGINGDDCQIGGGNINMPALPGGSTNMPMLPGGDINIPALPGGDTNMPMLPGGDTDMPALPGGDTNMPTVPESGSYAEQILNLVNAERSKAGLSALTLDASAERAANIRAQEIQQSFSHTRPDGSNFSTALSQAGVSFRTSGENIAYGQNSAEEVMQGWMNSSGHRANILNRNFTSIGIGHVEDARGTDYWTQLFFN